jgi:TrmH family RNA methyltransferase
MLSKSQLKDLGRYALKKRRDEEGVFVAEGGKLIEELSRTYTCKLLVGTEKLGNQPSIPCEKFLRATQDELDRITLQKTARDSFAVFKRPDTPCDNILERRNGLTLALDSVQDPGNLGTIIRICDWFGIEQVWCSVGCADIWNPKVVQSTMGALARVHISTGVCLVNALKEAHKMGLKIYGTLLDGENIYKKNLTENAIIVMGSEGNGLSKEVRRYVNEQLLIPSWPPDRPTSESLNVAVATALVLGEFRRRQ